MHNSHTEKKGEGHRYLKKPIEGKLCLEIYFSIWLNIQWNVINLAK